MNKYVNNGALSPVLHTRYCVARIYPFIRSRVQSFTA